MSALKHDNKIVIYAEILAPVRVADPAELIIMVLVADWKFWLPLPKALLPKI